MECAKLKSFCKGCLPIDAVVYVQITSVKNTSIFHGAV